MEVATPAIAGSVYTPDERNVGVNDSPLLGQDTETVLARWFGMSPDEIKEFVKEIPVEFARKS